MQLMDEQFCVPTKTPAKAAKDETTY